MDARPFVFVCCVFCAEIYCERGQSLVNLRCGFVVVWPQRQTFVRILLQSRIARLLRADLRRFLQDVGGWVSPCGVSPLVVFPPRGVWGLCPLRSSDDAVSMLSLRSRRHTLSPHRAAVSQTRAGRAQRRAPAPPCPSPRLADLPTIITRATRSSSSALPPPPQWPTYSTMLQSAPHPKP